MASINVFFKNRIDLLEFRNMAEAIYNREEILALFLCGSQSNKTLNEKREYSDYDFFLITTKIISKMQSLHYHINDTRVELMVYEKEKFCYPSSYDNNLLCKLLSRAEVVFSKEKCVTESFKLYARAKLEDDVSESELESMWFKIIWNVLKVKSYKQEDPDLAKILTMQNYFFIGLFYGRLCGKKMYNYSESLKFMRQNDPDLWKYYLNVLGSNEKIENIEKIVTMLPGYENYIKQKSLIELDHFISPITVQGDENFEIRRYKAEIDNLVLPLLGFL